MTEEQRKRRKEARPGEILAAAIEAFAEHGFAGATVEDIARRAGVAKGTVYLYFQTKDELFEALVREEIGPTFSQVGALVNSMPGSASDIITRVIEHIYANLVGNARRHTIMRILIAEGARFPQLARFYHDEVLEGCRDLLGEVIARGIAAGEFRDTPVRHDPQVIIGPALQAAIWRMAFEDVAPMDLERHRQAHLDLVLNGLRARGDDS